MLPRGFWRVEHRHVLEDAPLHVGEAEVIGVELGGDGVDVVLDLGARAPRQIEDRLHVLGDHVRLGGLPAHRLEAVELALGGLAHLGRQVGLLEAVAEAAGVARAARFAELPSDGAQLLAQDRPAPVLPILFAHVRVDLAPIRRRFISEQTRHRLEAGEHVEGGEDLHGLSTERSAPGHEIGDEARLVLRGGHAPHHVASPAGDPTTRSCSARASARLRRVAVGLVDRRAVPRRKGSVCTTSPMLRRPSALEHDAHRAAGCARSSDSERTRPRCGDRPARAPRRTVALRDSPITASARATGANAPSARARPAARWSPGKMVPCGGEDGER
jgi:hypothetical protein